MFQVSTVSTHSFTSQQRGWLLYVDLWEGFSVLGKGSYGDGFFKSAVTFS